MPAPDRKPKPVPESPDLIERKDLRPLWSVSQIVSKREDLRLDELEVRIKKLEQKRGRK